GTACVVTETTEMAMPEVFIGSAPDVGATRFFNDCPGRIGMYLALTGRRGRAAGAPFCGLANPHRPPQDPGALTSAAAHGRWRPGQEKAQAEAVVARFNPPAGEARLPVLRLAIDRCFRQGSVEAIVEAFSREPGVWAREALQAMERASPLSLKVVFRQIRLGAA